MKLYIIKAPVLIHTILELILTVVIYLINESFLEKFTLCYTVSYGGVNLNLITLCAAKYIGKYPLRNVFYFEFNSKCISPFRLIVFVQKRSSFDIYPFYVLF